MSLAARLTRHAPEPASRKTAPGMQASATAIHVSPRMTAQRRQLEGMFGEAAASTSETADSPCRAFIYQPGPVAQPAGAPASGVAQLEKEYAVIEGTGALIEADDDVQDRIGWLFYQDGEDFIWVKKVDRDKFEAEYTDAVLLSGGEEELDDPLGAPALDEDERKTPEHAADDLPVVPFELRRVKSIHIRKEKKGDHQYVIVIVEGGENLKIELGVGGHSMKRGSDISEDFGEPVGEYKPNEGLTAGQVVARFSLMAQTVVFDQEAYNCIRYAADFVGGLGTLTSQDDVADLFN